MIRPLAGVSFLCKQSTEKNLNHFDRKEEAPQLPVGRNCLVYDLYTCTRGKNMPVKQLFPCGLLSCILQIFPTY